MPKNSSKRTVCVVTGSRADYGLLYWVMKEIQGDPRLKLQVAVTGMHLSPAYGSTYKQIEADGFRIDAKIKIPLSDDSSIGTTKAVSRGLAGFGETFRKLKPDWVIVLGDRFEVLAAAEAALFARIPIAHIAGGDTTEGAFDEAIRHSITKMAHLHFVTNAVSARRVLQMGENPERVFNVGSPGIDFISRTKYLARQELARELDFEFKSKNLIVTFHPVTLSELRSEDLFGELLSALDSLGPDVCLIFTKSNADPDSKSISRMTDKFVKAHSNSRVFASLGQQRYLSLLREVDAMVGNSSSGLYEMPSFKKPTVNIGDRQRGRIEAASVLSCVCERQVIAQTIQRAFALDCSGVVNPYGDGNSSKRIKDAIAGITDPRGLLQKKFFLAEGNRF